MTRLQYKACVIRSTIKYARQSASRFQQQLRQPLEMVPGAQEYIRRDDTDDLLCPMPRGNYLT